MPSSAASSETSPPDSPAQYPCPHCDGTGVIFDRALPLEVELDSATNNTATARSRPRMLTQKVASPKAVVNHKRRALASGYSASQPTVVAENTKEQKNHTMNRRLSSLSQKLSEKSSWNATTSLISISSARRDEQAGATFSAVKQYHQEGRQGEGGDPGSPMDWSPTN